MLGAKILASNSFQAMRQSVQAVQHCTTVQLYSSTTLCTDVQLFSSEQEIDSHMCLMSTSWSEDLVSFSFYLTFVLVTYYNYMQTNVKEKQN